METIVYADILIIINIMVNYLLLRADAVLTSYGFKPLRFFISSLIGGLFSLIIYIDNIPSMLNLVLKIIFISVMVLTAFEIKSLKAFLKHFFAFSASNFIFGGIMLAINIFLLPNETLYNNGIVYFDINILTLTVISVVCYLILNLINLHIKNKTPPKTVYEIRIIYGDKFVQGKALFDSGNTLCDCFSGKPVVIAEESLIKNLISENCIEKMNNFRLIPYSTIGGNGTLPSFLADSVGINISGKWLFAEKIFIGVTDKKIISGGYSALIGSPYFDLVSDVINI